MGRRLVCARHADHPGQGWGEHSQQRCGGAERHLRCTLCDQRDVAGKLQAIALPLFGPQEHSLSLYILAWLPARARTADAMPGQFRNRETGFMGWPSQRIVMPSQQHVGATHLSLREIGMPAQGLFIGGLRFIDAPHATQDVGAIEGNQGARTVVAVGGFRIAVQCLFVAVQQKQDIGVQGLVFQGGQR